MAYKPIHPSPYLEAIDASEENIFKCLINPHDKITKYTLNITDNDTMEQAYEITGTSEQGTNHDSRLPINGRADNEAWLEITVPSETLENGKDYIWNITIYSTDGTSVKSFDYFFEARAGIEYNFSVPQTISTGTVSTTVTYTSEQGLFAEKYCFNLYLGGELIHTTGDIISSDISYKYDSLINNNQYTLELIVTDNKNRQEILECDFNVMYDNYTVQALPDISLDKDKMCVNVDYSKNININGVLENDTELILKKYPVNSGDSTDDETNAIELKNNQNLSWSAENQSWNDEVLFLHWHGHEGFSGTILEVSSNDKNLTIDYDGEVFRYTASPGEENFYFPYSTDNDGNRIYESAIIPQANIPFTPDENTLYILDDDDEINDTDTIVSNDITYSNWWLIVVRWDDVEFYKTDEYTETAVN